MFLGNEAAMWAACIAAFVLLERLFPRNPEQRIWREGSGRNLFWLVLNQLLDRSWARVGGTVLLLRATGAGPFLQRHLGPLSSLGSWPVWIQFAVIFALWDFLGWALHYLAHRVRFISRFHALHHSSESLDWLAAFRVHWLDSVYLDLSITLPLAILPVRDSVALVFGFLSLALPFYLHSNTRLRIAPRWLGSPAGHAWHHAAENQLAHGQNFGFGTFFWDRLFGTFYLPKDGAAPRRLGLFKPDGYPVGVARQLFGPFLPHSYDLSRTRSFPSTSTISPSR